MKKISSIVLIVLSVFFQISCKIQGITNDYSTLTEKQKSKILPLNDFTSLQSGFVYKINGAQLRNELKNHQKSIVYIFKNGCTSDYCKPLLVYETYAKANGYKLFLVMDGYINFDATMDQHIAGNLFVIDNDFYKIPKRNTYIRYFTNDLLNKPPDAKEEAYQGNLYFFHGSILQNITRELPK